MSTIWCDTGLEHHGPTISTTQSVKDFVENVALDESVCRDLGKVISRLRVEGADDLHNNAYLLY